MKYMKLGTKPDAFQSDGNNTRFVASELATDIAINVGDVKFYLHKFPLLSKSFLLKRLVASTSEEEDHEISIPDIPGGPVAFEICAKFCYGMIVTLNAYNVVAARCAAEYLEMHDSVEKGNLAYKIDVFLACSVFRSWKDMIIVLQTAIYFDPWTEDLKIVAHCIDSMASKASVDPSEVDWSYTHHRGKLPSENGDDEPWNGAMKQQSVPKDWWVEDLCDLEMDSYKRVIVAIKTKGRVPGDVIGAALKAYACRRLLGFCKSDATNAGDLMKHRDLLETIVRLLPTKRGSVSCSFLLKLLKAASFLGCSEDCKKDLIKRVGRQLEEASVSDLLVPAPVGGTTLYDVDLVLDLVEEFLVHERRGEIQESRDRVAAVSKLIDGCLGEAAKDPGLPMSKFVELSEAVPSSSRPVHDGLYHAIDAFLKERPELTKSEKKKICSLMDCKRLSAEACLHAVQNERLPLRVVVQVLFFEQLRRSAVGVCGSDLSSGDAQENGGVSRGSSSAAAMSNSGNDWEPIPADGDVGSIKAGKPWRGEGRANFKVKHSIS